MADTKTPKAEMTAQEYEYMLAKKKKQRSRWITFQHQIPLYFMMLPGIAYMIANNYLPMYGILIAFKKVNYSIGVFQSPWVGLENFEYLFTTKDAYIMIRNTLSYNLVWIAVGLVIALTIAIFMSEIAERKVAKLIQPVICFPFMISAVILSYLVYGFLSQSNGFMNRVVMNETVNWYSTPKYWPWILTIVHFWQGSGQSSIIYMAAISGIDKTLYEAAKIDGARKMQQIFKITLPMIRHMIILLMLMGIGRIFGSDFGLFYQVTLNSGMLYSTTQTIDTYVYRALLELNNVGMSSAASVFQAIIGFCLVIVSNAIVRKVDSDSALF